MARVDAKATVVFTVEGVVVAAVLTALSNSMFAGSIIGWRLAVAWLGVLSSAVAVLTAFIVIVPHLGRREVDNDSHFIYFGHLHRWDAPRLAERIAALSDEEQIVQLATQLTRLGTANWRKYLLLRVSVLAASLGALLLVVAFAWPHL
jgi:hypothetical protein